MLGVLYQFGPEYNQSGVINPRHLDPIGINVIWFKDQAMGTAIVCL